MKQRIVMLSVLALVFAAMVTVVMTADAAPLFTRSALTVASVSKTGTTLTLAAANVDGNKFTNNGLTWFQMANAAGESITATFETPKTYDGLAIADQTMVVANGATKVIGPFSTDTFNQGGTGSDADLVYVDYTYVTTLTGVTVGAFRFE